MQSTAIRANRQDGAGLTEHQLRLKATPHRRQTSFEHLKHTTNDKRPPFGERLVTH
jgi:hypothetical protein